MSTVGSPRVARIRRSRTAAWRAIAASQST
jgi:hypothetical protein